MAGGMCKDPHRTERKANMTSATEEACDGGKTYVENGVYSRRKKERKK